MEEGPVHEHASAVELLRGADLRVTSIRTAVLDVVAEHPHADVETIRSGVAGRLGSVSVQSVYDTLGTLRDAGLLRRLEPAGHPARYEFRGDHHHLACRGCGLIADVEFGPGEPGSLAPVDTKGFRVDEAEVVFWGLCPECAAGRT